MFISIYFSYHCPRRMQSILPLWPTKWKSLFFLIAAHLGHTGWSIITNAIHVNCRTDVVRTRLKSGKLSVIDLILNENGRALLSTHSEKRFVVYNEYGRDLKNMPHDYCAMVILNSLRREGAVDVKILTGGMKTFAKLFSNLCNQNVTIIFNMLFSPCLKNQLNRWRYIPYRPCLKNQSNRWRYLGHALKTNEFTNMCKNKICTSLKKKKKLSQVGKRLEEGRAWKSAPKPFTSDNKSSQNQAYVQGQLLPSLSQKISLLYKRRQKVVTLVIIHQRFMQDFTQLPADPNCSMLDT